MAERLLFVHGGGEGAHEEDRKLAERLRDELGTAYDVRCPKMPNEDSPEYVAWRDRISGELAASDGTVVLVGHSLGASVLLKYLSEEEIKRPVAGAFLLATPYWGARDWEVGEYVPREDLAAWLPEGLPVFLYHSRDDRVVPFEHLALYAEALPRAIIRELDGRGHQFEGDLSVVALDIKGSRRDGDLPERLGKPARRALAGAGYARLEQFTTVSEAEVLRLHGMGPRALGRIRDALAARGLSFARGSRDVP